MTVTANLDPGMPAEDARADVLALVAWNLQDGQDLDGLVGWTSSAGAAWAVRRG